MLPVSVVQPTEPKPLQDRFDLAGFAIDQPLANLGFQVVTGIVRQLQGALTHSNDRPGTRFLLDLPILSSPDESGSA